jgi:hypothetical protein
LATASVIEEGQNKNGPFWQVTQWNSILETNFGPEIDDHGLEDLVANATGPIFVTFTGTIVRTGAYWCDIGEDPLLTSTLLRCGRPQDATVRLFFKNQYFKHKELRDMLYKTFRVTGAFRT